VQVPTFGPLGPNGARKTAPMRVLMDILAADSAVRIPRAGAGWGAPEAARRARGLTAATPEGVRP